MALLTRDSGLPQNMPGTLRWYMIVLDPCIFLIMMGNESGSLCRKPGAAKYVDRTRQCAIQHSGVSGSPRK